MKINTDTHSAPLFINFSLHDRLLLAIEKLAYRQCTPVQEQAIPLILNKQDLLVTAETGSGKTAAFLLPILHQLLITDNRNSGTRALVLAPTRELAQQLFKQAQQFSEFTRIQIGLIIGGEDFKYQKSVFRKNPEIIIATPGRLTEHLTHQTPDFNDLEILVLDEADRMLDMGFGEEVLNIVENCNKQRQTLLFSATLSHAGIKKVADKILQDAKVITVSSMQDKHTAIKQQIITADSNSHKQQILTWLLTNQTFDKALIFTNTREQAGKLQGPLRGQRIKVSVLHGEMDQSRRKQIMQLFRQGAINILIATDLAARGLDIEGIDLVVNFDMARNATDYVHRIGRTGRAGQDGLAIALIKANEWNLMTGIERYLKQKFELRVISELTGKYKGPEKQKKSGKAAGLKKQKSSKKNSLEKTKARHRDKKNVGKRRQPSNPEQTDFVKSGGWAVIKKQSSSE